ncbi:MAG: GumC family protein [Thermodesulfobacteriota bacterium]
MDNKNTPDLYKNKPPSPYERANLPENIYQQQDINLADSNQIKDYFDILLRHKWIIILSLLFCIITVAISTFLTKPLYKATAVIEIIPNPPKVTSFEKEAESGYTYWDTEEFYETHYKLLKSKSFAKHVVNKIGLMPKEDINVNKKEEENISFITFVKNALYDIIGQKKEVKKDEVFDIYEESQQRKSLEDSVANAFLGGVNITPDRKTRLTYINYISTDPKYATQSVNTLVDEYIRWTLSRKHDSTKVAREFLETQLDDSKANLERSEEELSKFAKSVNVVSLDKDLNLIYKQLAELNEAYARAETEMLSKKAVYNEIEGGNYDYLPEVIDDESMQELLVLRTELNSEYLKKSTTYGPNYPEMKQLKAQLGAVSAAIDKKKGDIAQSLKKEYRASVNKESLLKKRAMEQNQRAAVLNEQSIQYKILEREVNTNKSIYDQLLQRLKETEITSAVATTNINVVDYAVTPKFPFKPNIKSNIMLAIFIGLLIGCFLAILIEHFDNAVRDEEEIKRKVPLPFLGSVPFLNDPDSQKDMEKIVHNNPRSLISEAFRVIRTSIMFANPDNPPRTLLVTSSQPFEGKTTSASNLAISLSQTGKSVVLVDADLRKPRMHKLFINGNKNAYGLTNYLIGEANIDEIIHKHDSVGLNVVYSGSLPPNPAELLGSNKMNDLISKLIEKYDYVVLDGAPVLGFADSRLLSRYVDGVLLVTSIGITQRNNLKTVIDDIYKVGGNVLGTIVNRQSARKGKYGYNYYYYYNDELGHDVKKIPKLRGPRA